MVRSGCTAACCHSFLGGPVIMGAHSLLARCHAHPSILVAIIVLVALLLVMVDGQEDEEGRNGRKLVLKKVRRKQPQPIGQCPQVRCSP